MLTADELSAMTDVEESVMITTAYIVRAGTATDGMGGFIETWGTVGTVLCDLWPINRRGERESINGGQPISEATWFITMPVGSSVTAKDRVESAGRTFEVMAVPDQAQWQTAVRVEARIFNNERRT